MKRLSWVLMVLISPSLSANNHIDQMTIKEKCSIWEQRGRELVHQYFDGVSKSQQYSVIESGDGDNEIKEVQKMQVDLVYNNYPKAENPYERIQLANINAKGMYDFCIDLYINEPK